jgi:hypothetical protein
MATETIDSNREQLTFERLQDRDDLLAKNVLVTDPRRQRPYWFDGRFLAASDLRHEQNYFLLRQSDLGRAGGEGVVEGLLVKEGVSPTSGTEILQIAPGFGYTDTGELVSVDAGFSIVPSDIPKAQQLDAAFGLEIIPNASGLNRTGLFVLALRPVEWTANSIAAYPTSINGQRNVEDADIVEGVAVTLIPWPDNAGELSWTRRRSRAAREIFVNRRARGGPTGTLPIAMVALRGNFIEWVDPFLVRRELGADRREGLDFGFGQRALREAHLLQYESHLAEILTPNPAISFAATAQFDALPPAGRLPVGAVDAQQLTQQFFPRGLDVEVSFLPDDELPALLEESFLLPPIDLLADAKAMLGIAVLVLAPLPRAQFEQRQRALAGKSWKLAFSAPESKVEATPFELLFAQAPSDAAAESLLVTRAGNADAAGEAEWRNLLKQASGQGTLWFVRRRHLPGNANVGGTPVDANSSEDALPEDLAQALAAPANADVAQIVTTLRNLDQPAVDALLSNLARPSLLANELFLLRGLLAPFRDRAPGSISLFEATRILVHTTNPRFGRGISLLKDDTRVQIVSVFGRAGLLAEADDLLVEVPESRLDGLREAIKPVTKDSGLLSQQLAELRAKFLSP